MSRRTLAIVLLAFIGVGGLATAGSMLTAAKDAPPKAIPVLIIVCSVGSMAAAIGLSQRRFWAVRLGAGSRVVDLVLALTGIFTAPGAGQKAGAGVDVILSVVTLIVLRCLRTLDAQ